MVDLEQSRVDLYDGNSRKSADNHDVSQAERKVSSFNDPLIVVRGLTA